MFHLRCRSRLDLDWRFFATSSQTFCGSCEQELHERLTARWTADERDVDATTGAPRVEQIEAKLDDATRAVLLAPLFGRLVCWPEAARHCETRGVLTIEDRAQYLPENVQQQTSSDSQVLLYSFDPLKRLTALGGAIVRTQRTPLLQSMRQNQRLLPQQSDLQYFRRVAKYVGLFALMNPCAAAWFATALKCTRRNLDDVVDRLVRNFPPDQPTAIGTRPSSALLRQMCQRQDHPSCWNRVNSRRVRQWLSGLPACFQADIHAEHLYWMVTLQADDTEAELTRLTTILQSVHMPISGQIQPSRNGR